MDRLLNISDRANAALHALALSALAAEPLSAREAAERLGVSPSYLAKTLQPLARSGLLLSTRGAAGGFVLSRPPAEISCLEVLELLDGPLAARDCLFQKAVCAKGSCAIRGLCAEVERRAREVFAGTSIAELAAAL